MDFHGLKRKQLQALCKEHGVPANLTNREMADRLASIFKENEEPISLQKLGTNPEEMGSENEAKVVKKQAKKVRFSPENQIIENEVSVYQRQLLPKNPAQVIENAPNGDNVGKVENCQVRVTKSRVQNVVEDDVSTVFSPPVGTKRGRRGLRNKVAEVNNFGKSEVFGVGEREDVKNGHDKATGRLSGRQLRSRKNVTQEESKIRKVKGGDEVHFCDDISEESDVLSEDVKSKNGRKQPMRNARKENQSGALNSEVEKVEVVSRVTRQSRAQSTDVASMVKNEVKAVGVQSGCEEVLQLKEHQKGRRKSALSQNAVPQRVSAESSLLAVEGAEAEKPLRRSKHNAEKGCSKTATSVKNQSQVTKVQEQSERAIVLEEAPECLRRYSSRRKSVVPRIVKGRNEEDFLKRETRKRNRTTELDAIVEHSGEVERVKYAFTSQDQAPLRRSRRKTVILNAPAHTEKEFANKEDIGKMQQLRTPFLGKDVTEELPRKSSQNASRYSLSGASKEDQIAVPKKDLGVKQQRQEPILEEETSVVEHHPETEKPQRRSNRIASISVSVSPLNPAAKLDEKKQQSKYTMAITKEEAALTENRPDPGELPAKKEELVAAEGTRNKNDLDFNVSKQAAENADGCSNKKRRVLRGNNGAKKQYGFSEASPPFLDVEECEDSAGNMEETLITTSGKLVGLSTDQEMQQSTDKYMTVLEESNLVGDDREKFVHSGNGESEVNCMSSQSVSTTCISANANCSDSKLLESESNDSQVVDSSKMIPAESQGRGMSDQEMMEDIKPVDTRSAHESSAVYKDDRSPVESDKERLVQVDIADNEMNHQQSSWSLNRRGAVDDSNLDESRQVEFESNLVNMDSSEITSLANGATSTLLNPEKELETKPPLVENTNFASDNVNADDSRTPFGEAQILVELKHINVPAADSIRKAIFKDHVVEFGESSSGSENYLKRAQEVIGTDFSNREGIPHIESSVEATESQESSAEFHFATAETCAQKIIEIQQCSYGNNAALETPCGSAAGNQFIDKTCSFDAADTAGDGISDQERSEDLNTGNAHCIHESVLISEENTELVKNDEEMIHDDTSEGEMKHPPCLSLSVADAMDNSNLVEPRMVDFESNGSKVICPEINSLANIFSFGSQANLAGKTSSHIELEKVLETEEPSENMNSIIYNMDAEGSRIPLEEDQMKVQFKDANVSAADSMGEVIFNDLLNELGESIGWKRGSEVPLKKSEKLSATEFSDGEGIALTESSIKATEKQEYGAEIDIVTEITATSNITGMKFSSSSDTATCKTPVASAPQKQDKLRSAGITVFIAGSEICNQVEQTSLVDDDKEVVIQDDTIVCEIKCPCCPFLNKTCALADALVEPTMVEFESNANKVVYSEMTSLADVCSSASQANPAGETSNELKLMKILESEESARGENVDYKSDKVDVEDDKSSAQDDQNSMHLEDANIPAVEPVQGVVFWDSLNELCGSCGAKEFVESFKKAEETSTNGSSQPQSSVEINEKSEATVKIHTISAETGEKTNMEMQCSLSDQDTTLISPLRPQVGGGDVQCTISRVETPASNAEYGKCGDQKNEENVKIVEREHEQTLNTEKELFFSGKKILVEGKFLADGVCHSLPDSRCAKDKKTDISDGSYNNVSGETHGKHISGVSDGEGTDLVSSEEKDNSKFKGASHADVSPQCIFKESFNGSLPVQEKSEAVCMDNRNMTNESEAAKLGAENGEVNARTFSNATQALPSEKLITPMMSEPFSMRSHDHALVDGESNSCGERVVDHPFKKDFAATMDSNGISSSRETDIGQDENIMEEIVISTLKVSLADNSGCKVEAELYDTNTSVTKTIFQETDVYGVVSTEFPEEMPNASEGTRLPFEKATYGDLDDQGEEVGLQRHCSSSSGLDGFKSTVGIIVDKISNVDKQESTLNSNNPQSGRKVGYPDVNDCNSANKRDDAFTVEEAGLEDGEKAPVSHQKSLPGGNQEEVPSYADTPCRKPEVVIGSSSLLCSSIPVSCEKELHPQVTDDINDVGGTEISIDYKVTREERDVWQVNAGGFSDTSDASLVERSKGDIEEMAEAKSDDCEGSVKTATFMDSIDSLVVNEPPCLDESKNCDIKIEEPLGLYLPDNIAGDSREVGSCSKLDIVSSVKHEMVVHSSSVSSICASSDEHKHLENPDESHVLTNKERSLFLGGEDEVEKPDRKASDSNDAALDKTITECNSSDIKEDYAARSEVEDANFSAKKDGPEDIEETMELTKDVSEMDAVMTDKSPFLMNSEVGRVVDREEAFRSDQNFLSSQKKNMTARKQGSNGVLVKQFPSSIVKSKSKSSLIQRTPKRLKIDDMKENEPSTKREQIGNRTTPKTSSKRRPLALVWK
ncbi:hypothetical protein REPUB_Repub19eG0127000 [Reevesia pubescens]